MNLLARREGLFASPESGAAAIAAQKLRASGFLKPNDETVIFSTGGGLMHTDLVHATFSIVEPDVANVPF